MQVLLYVVLFVSLTMTLIFPILSNILISFNYYNPFFPLNRYDFSMLVYFLLCNFFFGFGLLYKLKNTKREFLIYNRHPNLVMVSFIMITAIVIFFIVGISSGIGFIAFNIITSCLLYINKISDFSKKSSFYFYLIYTCLCFYILFLTGLYVIILWQTVLLLIIENINKKASIRKFLYYSLIGFISLIFIQLTKPILRNYLANEDKLSINPFNDINLLDPLAILILRGDHSKYISQVIDHVPKYQNFEFGKTYIISALSAFIPNTIIQNDAGGDGKKFVCKYIGDCSTNEVGSYNIGLFGEAYVNFGYFAIIFLFLIGRVYNLIFNLYINWYEANPIMGIFFCLYFSCFFTLENDSTAFFKLLFYGLFIIAILRYILRIKFI